MMEKINGIIAAPYTPFDINGHVDVNKIPAYAKYLRESGVSGVFVNGTTGEGASLTIDERIACAEAWVAEKQPHFKIFIHVGHNSVVDSKELAIHAESIGADATGLVAPNFFKPVDNSALVKFNAEVASAAPNLPYYYYHIPSMTGLQFSMLDFLKSADSDIPNFAGIKFTHEDLMEMKLCMEYADGKFDILHGRDEILICGLVLGAKGAIGSTYNYMGTLYVDLIKAFESGDISTAQNLQNQAIKIIRVLIKYGGGVTAGKSFMRFVGLDLGGSRLPLVGLSNDDEKQLKNELNELDFFSYTNKSNF